MAEKFIVMDKCIYSPRIEEFDFLFYNPSIDPEPNMFVVYELDGDITADVVGVVNNGTLTLMGGICIGNGDVLGVVTEIRRPSSNSINHIKTVTRWVNAYHARHPETPYNLLWDEAEAAFMAALH